MDEQLNKQQICRRHPNRNIKTNWTLPILIMLMVGIGRDEAYMCPTMECLCGISENGPYGNVLRTACTKGAMTSVPIEALDRDTEILIISAPTQKPNFLTIGPIFTQPEPFKNLRELHIVNSNIPSIGQYSFWGLQNLRLINLTHNNLSGIVTDNFRGLINLTELHLDNNIIEQMPSETFRHLTSLRTLTLSHNRISILVPRLFRMLAKLTYLDLSENPLPDLNPEVFKDIQHLKVFKCRRCTLKRVNTHIYHLTPNLEELDLGENLFEYITPDEFTNLKKLRMLKLDGNLLAVIVDNTFGWQRELRVLSLSRNRLALLAPAALSNLSSLNHLDLSYNKIDRYYVQTFVPVSKTLRSVDLSGNNLPINEIASLLQMLPEIQGVGLANLSISNLPQYFFSNNDHLVVLDLSWNKLKSFPIKLLSKTRYLQKLDLSHNKMESLDETDLERLEAIAQVSLSGNSWHCDQCAVGPLLVYMATTVLNETLRSLKCYIPYRLRGTPLSRLSFDQLDACPSTYEAQLSLIAGLILLCVSIFAALTTALCCTRRRAAHYYTNEEKRREHDHPEELLGHTEFGSVATIRSPYSLMTKES